MTVLQHTLALGCVITLAVALPAAAEERAIEEIVVTAQKREQSSNDIGMAISAFTGEGLEEIGVLTAEDIALQTPGLSVGDGGGLGVPIYTIRGIGFDSININASSTVGVYVDEVAVPYPIMTMGQLFDIERVEVLKGPQGDLYGRNTTGGAISFFSRRPTDTLEAGINVDYGSYDYTRIEGFVSGPLADNLRGRLAAVKTDQDGWQDVYSLDEETFEPFKAADNGELDELSVRGTLDWDVSDIASVSVGAYHSRDKSDEVALKNVGENVPLNIFADDPENPTTIYYLVRHTVDDVAETLTSGSYLGIPLDPEAAVVPMTQNGNQDDWKTVYLSTRPTRDNRSDGASLKVDVDFENFTLTSITGYDRFKRERTIDWDASWWLIADNFSDAEIKSFSQELRLTSAGEGDLTWIAGVYYSDDSVEEDYITRALDSAIAGFDVGTGYEQDTETIAVFGHAEWQFSDPFKLTLGLRYTDEERSIDNLGTILVDDPFEVFGVPNGFILTDFGGPLFSDSIDTQKVSGRMVLDYTPNDTMLFYGSVSTGFKSGGFNAENAITSAQYEPYGPEEVVAYELGFKLSLLERTMQLNGAGFYYDYTDKQTVDFIPTAFGPLGILANVDESEVTGAELDLTWSPLAGLDVVAGVSYLDSEVREYVGFYGSREGFELPNTPKWSYNAVVSYEFPLTEGIYLRTLANYAWVDSSRSALEDADYFVTDSYGVLGARVALVAADGRWEAALWGRNIGDKEYFVYNGFVSEALHAQPAMPATYGLSVSYNYF